LILSVRDGTEEAEMRGRDRQTGQLFSYASPDSLVPADHPLRAIRLLVNAALERLSRDFGKIYADNGRPSIAPEKLLRALLLQALFTIRSERQLMQQITYNMLFRWFVGLAMDAPVWDVTVFTKNRDRLLEGDIARGFLAAILIDPQVTPLLSSEHFSVDGTLIDAWASMKSFRPKDGSGEPPASGRNSERDYHGEKRSNETHASTTDPDARLLKKSSGDASRLCHMGHVLMENRHGLVVDAALTIATGTAEREAAIAMIGDLPVGDRVTLGGDKAYDTRDFVAAMRRLGVTPHVTQVTKGRPSAIDGRTTRHAGYPISVRIRKRIEEVFGWMKTVGMMRKTRHRGNARVGWMFIFVAAAYNLVRIPKLLAGEA
jgi:transposase